MSTFQVSDPSKTKDVVKRAFYLAYLAAGSSLGMGIFQARSAASEEDIWTNVATHGDYGVGLVPGMADASKGDAYGDYVFGRMLKLSIKFDEKAGTITVPNHAPQSDYQGWSSGKPQNPFDAPSRRQQGAEGLSDLRGVDRGCGQRTGRLTDAG